MSHAPDPTVATPIPSTELLGLFPEPTALFDSEGRLAVANPAFGRVFGPIEQFIRPGTPWDILLAEAERKHILSPKACGELRLVEEALLIQPSEVPKVETKLSNGTQAEIVLSALSDGGFAMRLDLSGQGNQEDGDIEQVMATVLEACPTSLTMARIGDGQILYRSPSATELAWQGPEQSRSLCTPRGARRFRDHPTSRRACR